MDHKNYMLEFSDNDEQFVISYELLCLLNWLIEHDIDKLKKMITRAMSRGLNTKIQKIQEYSDEDALEDAQINMIEFFSSLERILVETMEEYRSQRTLEKNLIPAIDLIDASACDESVVKYSLEKTTGIITQNSTEKPKDILFKEILKNWKPTKNQATQ